MNAHPYILIIYLYVAESNSSRNEEGTFRSDIAYRVMTEYTGMIKEKVGLYPLVDRLVENRVISHVEKDQIIDTSTVLTADQRMDKLLSLLKESIKEDGEDFGLFLEIIKHVDTKRADRLAQTLLDKYKDYYVI
ncbi:PREDICTED: uncharacterized protein LOC109588997 [Amphimedon queenslandica]|uniref:CARD domain-containing protein n=1 Tax=Amphimedon queenslandica TaxID=400682 RepID=A0A1X7TAR0_AMPQE|nr:PREDICTED: uncharacterized protein LOC109588997 [Amphimedon queenslandica]|eukprot:XP_019860676.1 PREDICTED: uncharacterized protein LOC109588997 [Amphimedon queenslandica]